MTRLCILGYIVVLLCRVTDCRLMLDGLQRYSPMPMYLPVQYRVLNAESSFFLKEANQDIMRNSSLQARTELFFIQQAHRTPLVNASYGPYTVQQPVPMDLLGPSQFGSLSSATASASPSSPPLFTFNWKVQTYIISERIYPSWPKVQVLFYVSGRDWDDYTAVDRLPCVRMFAFYETQEVRGTCRLKGELGMCVAELEPLASWFSPPSVVPGKQRAPEQAEGTPVELYYMVQFTDGGECNPEDSRKPAGIRAAPQPGPMGYFSGPTPMRRIGSVRLYQPLSELRLDSTFVVMLPSRPMRQRETVSAFLAASTLSPLDIFTLRVKLKDGVAFLGARASNPAQWTVSQDARSEGHRVVTLHCRRKDANYGQRMEAAFQKVLQVDLEVNGLLDPLSIRTVTWQVEYPLTRTLSDEIQTLIRLAPQDLGGIVPLAMDTEILNTAVLNGRTVAVPVKVVTVGTDGSVTDVTESVECRSTDEDVVKVSERCDYVFVNGKETGGRVRMLVNFTYSYLSAQLEVSVWMPRLPLRIELSDTELSQIKGWRVPVSAINQRKSSWDSEEEEDRKGRGCMLQYQHALVRVLTPFLADADDPAGGTAASLPAYFLGPEWQVDVTCLVQDSMRVGDPSVARLQSDTVLAGRAVGVTSVQVMSPLSDLVLAERVVRVLDDKVSITELGVQLVSGLALNLQLSPGSNRAIVATATTQELMQSLKQEALISPWVQFSDGSLTSLDLYDPSGYTLSASSIDESVVSVQRGPHPQLSAVAEGDGQGSLLRVELGICEACQKSKRKSKLAVGSGAVRVTLLPILAAPEEGGEATGRMESGAGGVAAQDRGGNAKAPKGEIKQALTSPRAVPLDIYTQAVLQDSRARERSTTSPLQEALGMGVMSTAQTIRSTKEATTSKPPSNRAVPTAGRGNTEKKEMGNLLMNSISHFGPEGPSPLDLFRKNVPKAVVPKEEVFTEEPPLMESDLVRAFGVAFSDLEICIYALVGVSCLAILGFLLNCATYSLRSHSKKTPVQPQDPREHRHHWVRLSTTSEQGRPPPPPMQACQNHPEPHHLPMEAPSMPPSEERTATLGRRSSSQPCRTDSMPRRSATLLARPVRTEPLHSPTSKRNQVQFTTFTTLDIKHLAALKRNGLEVSWAVPVSNYGEPNGVPLPDIPYPAVIPHVQA